MRGRPQGMAQYSSALTRDFYDELVVVDRLVLEGARELYTVLGRGRVMSRYTNRSGKEFVATVRLTLGRGVLFRLLGG